MNALLTVQSISASDVTAGEHLTGAGPFIIGIVLAALLAGAMWWDGRRRDQQAPAPPPAEQPKPPDHPTHIEEVRVPDEDDFPHDGGRLLPYNLKTHSTHGAGQGRESGPPRGGEGGGAVGGGGPGG
ncbi:DUF6479 family protein [Streptomyces sp. NBC_01142]|uniref:DUF6479 family protein n=1 Tax=Streptomyces sp. NBC_01142 TaxID=2975865 RepID=UPI0022582E31|nr:DUF6479 family protein [Streptomyces sp. NBC_01142]MCX4823963.1 DUF6479 family protein [Streptomyces sp. NBC_01142]